MARKHYKIIKRWILNQVGNQYFQDSDDISLFNKDTKGTLYDVYDLSPLSFAGLVSNINIPGDVLVLEGDAQTFTLKSVSHDMLYVQSAAMPANSVLRVRLSSTWGTVFHLTKVTNTLKIGVDLKALYVYANYSELQRSRVEYNPDYYFLDSASYETLTEKGEILDELSSKWTQYQEASLPSFHLVEAFDGTASSPMISVPVVGTSGCKLYDPQMDSTVVSEFSTLPSPDFIFTKKKLLKVEEQHYSLLLAVLEDMFQTKHHVNFKAEAERVHAAFQNADWICTQAGQTLSIEDLVNDEFSLHNQPEKLTAFFDMFGAPYSIWVEIPAYGPFAKELKISRKKGKYSISSHGYVYSETKNVYDVPALIRKLFEPDAAGNMLIASKDSFRDVHDEWTIQNFKTKAIRIQHLKDPTLQLTFAAQRYSM